MAGLYQTDKRYTFRKMIIDQLKTSQHDYWVTVSGWDNYGYNRAAKYGNEFRRTFNIANYITPRYANLLKNDGNPLRLYGIFGHEIFHAFDDDIGSYDPSQSSYDALEDRAVRFENYLYAYYGYKDRRTKYTGRDVPFPNALINQVKNPLNSNFLTEQTLNVKKLLWIFSWNDEIKPPSQKDCKCY